MLSVTSQLQQFMDSTVKYHNEKAFDEIIFPGIIDALRSTKDLPE